MQKYWLIFRLSILDLFEYRFDFVMHTAKYAFMVLMMSLVWLAVQKAQGLPASAGRELIAYFILAAILYSLSNFHTYYIEEDIKLGQLSKFLLKPVSYFYYYLVFQLGHVVMETILKLSVLGLVLVVWGFSFQFSLPILGLVLAFLPVVFWCAFNLFSIVSLLTFWLTEAWALRWALSIIFRLLSGMLVPISFFPEFWQQTLYFLPFEHFAYTPIQLLQNKLSFTAGLQALLILVSWTIVLHAVRTLIWRRGIKSYEGTGI